MLIDALVFGVYKCVSSLLNVSVLLLLELDFKRVYFIQTGADRHVTSVLRLPQEDVVAIFRYLFLLLDEELPSLKPNLWMLLAPQSETECLKELHKSKTVCYYTEKTK